MEQQLVTEQVTEQARIELPDILTANTFYWRPGRTASERRSNESRQRRKVAEFLKAHEDVLKAAGIEVRFYYEESCNHVYKKVKVYENGVLKDIRALKKALGIK